MISKRDLVARICYLEIQCTEYEEDIRELQLKIKKLEKKIK
jgi:hypothetical protein